MTALPLVATLGVSRTAGNQIIVRFDELAATKPVRREALLRAVQNALGVDAKGRAARAVLRELQNRYENLTPREREVLAHVVSGKLNKQIAFDLGAAERTIKAHRASIMAKLGVQSIAELVRLAQELGIEPIR